MEYEKFRDLEVDIYDIKFDTFKIKDVLNYMPAGNDVLEVLTIDNKNYFIKIERSKVTDFDSEVKHLSILKNKNINFIPNVIEYKKYKNHKIIVLDKIVGERLNKTINNDNKEQYIKELAKELSYIHRIEDKGFGKAKLRVINSVPTNNLYNSSYYGIEKYIEYLKENDYEKTMDTFIHGDYHYGNILWKDNKIVGVLDWEYSGLGHKEQDIAWALIVRPSQMLFKRVEEIELFLDEYNKDGNCDKNKVKWCLINGYSHFYMMNSDNEYKEFIKKILEEIINI